MKKLVLLLALFIVGLAVLQQHNLTQNIPFLSKLFQTQKPLKVITNDSKEQKIVTSEESVITKVVDESLPSVVTISIQKDSLNNSEDPFDPFAPLRRRSSTNNNEDRNIGSGFIISTDGLIITNKHVVSDPDYTYLVLTNDKKKYTVEKIYRDPLNDLSIIKINASGLKPLKLGNSSNLKLGQIAIAIGTPLGEFTNTITTGVVSGLGRGITAGSPFEGYVEKLDNVIQTDAAINPGNSGGPLLNSSGEVIGINTAVSASGQNIGFAIPVNIVKNLIDTFNKNGGSFERPYIGVRYQMVDQRTAKLNDIVEGAYVEAIINNSPAEKAGIQEEDVITEFDGKKINGEDNESLTRMILEKKVGDKAQIKIWRNGKTEEKTLTLDAFTE